MPGRPSDTLPDFIDPELATLVERAPEGNAWLHEIKLDGYRTDAQIELRPGSSAAAPPELLGAPLPPESPESSPTSEFARPQGY